MIKFTAIFRPSSLMLLLLLLLFQGCISEGENDASSFLDAIEVSPSGGLIPDFQRNQYEYAVEVDATTDIVELKVDAQSNLATVRVAGVESEGSFTRDIIPLTGTITPIVIDVEAFEQASTETYIVRVYRGVSAPAVPISGDVDSDGGSNSGGDTGGGSGSGSGSDGGDDDGSDNGDNGSDGGSGSGSGSGSGGSDDSTGLNHLEIYPGTLQQLFQQSQSDYSADSLGFLSTSLEVVTAAGEDDLVSINGVRVPSVETSTLVPLAVGSNQINISVRPVLSGGIGDYRIHINRRSAPELREMSYLKPDSATLRGAQFGFNIAMQGNLLAVGAPEEDSSRGAVYLFEQDNDQWRAVDRITAANGAAGDRFGQSVDLQQDVMVIGASRRGVQDSGGVYIYRRSGNVWSQSTLLSPPAARANGNYGFQVRVSDDWLVVGSLRGDAAGSGAGNVYVYRASGSSWILDQTLGEAGSGPNDHYSSSIELDGNRIAIGSFSQQNCQTAPGSDAGSVSIYEYQNNRWRLQETLNGEGPQDRFGFSIDLNGDELAVGAQCEDARHSSDTEGAVYMYRYLGGRWMLTAKIKSPEGSIGRFSLFGDRIALKDGLLIATASYENRGSGAAYLFERTVAGGYSNVRQLLPGNSNQGDRFGISLASDGEWIAIAAPEEDGAPNRPDSNDWNESGAVYLFK